MHAIGVGLQTVDRIGGTSDDVVSQRQRLQMRQQSCTQCVDEPLPGVDLHLHVDHRERLREDLQQQSSAHHQHEERRTAVTSQRGANAVEGAGQRPPLEDIVHDQLQRPRREHAERDVRRGDCGEDRDAAAIRPHTRPRPGSQGHYSIVRLARETTSWRWLRVITPATWMGRPRETLTTVTAPLSSTT